MPKTSIHSLRKRQSKSVALDNELSPLAQQWIMRLLVPLQGHRCFMNKESVHEYELAKALGLGTWIDLDESEFSRSTVMKILRAQHQEIDLLDSVVIFTPAPLLSLTDFAHI